MGAASGEEGEGDDGDSECGSALEGGLPPGPPADPPFDIHQLIDKAKFYTSLCLGTTAIVSVFAFLFLIPFVVDPVVSSIMADFEPEPVTCIVVEHVYAEGLRNCSWASCREGCTASPNRCHQMLVNYSRVPYREWRTRLFNTSEPVPVVPTPPPTAPPPPPTPWRKPTPSPPPPPPTPSAAPTTSPAPTPSPEPGPEDLDPGAFAHDLVDWAPEALPADFRNRLPLVAWDVAETRFLVNTEGCGYPPKVNCTEFAKKYGGRHMLKPFPCYYSRTYPEQVVARYSWEQNLRNLVLSLVVPNVLFAVAVGVLSYWYCPSCNRGGCGSTKKPFLEKYVPAEQENEDDDDDEYEEEEEEY